MQTISAVSSNVVVRGDSSPVQSMTLCLCSYTAAVSYSLHFVKNSLSSLVPPLSSGYVIPRSRDY